MQDESKPVVRTRRKLPILKYINLKTIIAFIAGVVLTLLVIAGIKLFSTHRAEEEPFEYETILDMSQYIPDLDSSWTVISADPRASEIKFESGHGFDGRSMILYFHKTGANDFTFTSPSGETYMYTINIDQNKKISVYRR